MPASTKMPANLRRARVRAFPKQIQRQGANLNGTPVNAREIATAAIASGNFVDSATQNASQRFPTLTPVPSTVFHYAQRTIDTIKHTLFSFRPPAVPIPQILQRRNASLTTSAPRRRRELGKEDYALAQNQGKNRLQILPDGALTLTLMPLALSPMALLSAPPQKMDRSACPF